MIFFPLLLCLENSLSSRDQINIIEMFEAVEWYGWIVNNNIHGLEVVTEKKKGGRNQNFLYPPKPSPRLKVGTGIKEMDEGDQ